MRGRIQAPAPQKPSRRRRCVTDSAQIVESADRLPAVPVFRIKEAADLLGVSGDTVRRWADGGRIETTTDASGRAAIDGAELARFAEVVARDAAQVPPGDIAAASVRNRFTGLVTRVVKDTVMAQVEIQSGPAPLRLPDEP